MLAFLLFVCTSGGEGAWRAADTDLQAAQMRAFYQRQGMTGPLSCHRVKVTFKDEPGEGSGVARSFFTEFVDAVLSEERLPNLDPIYSRPMCKCLNCFYFGGGGKRPSCSLLCLG